MSTEYTSPELPDGSGFSTGIVMSKEEAMALPLKKRPLAFRLPSELYHFIWEQVGAASMCWNPRPSTEVFDSSAAEKVALDLCFKVADALESTGKDTEMLNSLEALPWFTCNRGEVEGQTGVLIPGQVYPFYAPTLREAITAAMQKEEVGRE